MVTAKRLHDGEHKENSALREEIYSILSKDDLSPDGAIRILSQCKTETQDRLLLEQFAKELGLQLSGFFHEGLELYYDIERKQHDLGFISKEWDGPGFMIGNLIKIPARKIKKFKKIADDLLKHCMTNGIGMFFHEIENGLEIYMHGVIYQEGFNKETFIKTLETLNECVDKAESLNVPKSNIWP